MILELFSKPKTKKEDAKTSIPQMQSYEAENKVAKETKAKAKTPIQSVRFKNDSTRLQKEYTQLKSKNKDLLDLIEDLNKFSQKEFKKVLTITMIYRTQEEQDYLYRNSEKYKKRKFKSPHQFFHAVDVRSKTFTNDQIKQMVDYINKKYDSKNYYKWTAKCHSVGHGMHFHIQFTKP
jgi:hypothetical protein